MRRSRPREIQGTCLIRTGLREVDREGAAAAAAEAHAQAAAQQPAASAGQRMAAMRELLSKWRLDGYADAFDREGYDDVEFLLGMAADKEDLRKVTRAVDTKRGHAARCIGYVERLAAPSGLVRGAPAPLALAT